jgi:hypothetical protein
MTTITTKDEFDALIQADQAVLFTFFDWSGQAHLSLQVFEEWEREWRAQHPTASVAFFRLDPDNYRECWAWLGEHAGGEDGLEGGFGSVVWLRRGKTIGFARYAANEGKNRLSRLTAEYFGSARAA